MHSESESGYESQVSMDEPFTPMFKKEPHHDGQLPDITYVYCLQIPPLMIHLPFYLLFFPLRSLRYTDQTTVLLQSWG